MLKEFKEFILEGDLVEVAIGLILALYVKTVVDSLVADIITPIVAAMFGVPDFCTLKIEIGDSAIMYWQLPERSDLVRHRRLLCSS